MGKRARSDNLGPDDEYLAHPKRPKASPASKKSKKKKKDESHFPFLDLPGEIRNMIYEQALTAAKGEIDIHRVWDADTQARTKPARQSKYSRKKKYKDIGLHLLRVNKQVRKEATPILYSQNTFKFSNAQGLASFFGRNSLHVRDLSRIVICDELWLDSGPGTRLAIETAFNLLSFAENIQSLELTLKWTQSGDLNVAAQSFFLLARNWLQAVGTRKGDKRAAMDILTIDDIEMSSRPTRVGDRVELFQEALGQALAD